MEIKIKRGKENKKINLSIELAIEFTLIFCLVMLLLPDDIQPSWWWVIVAFIADILVEYIRKDKEDTT